MDTETEAHLRKRSLQNVGQFPTIWNYISNFLGIKHIEVKCRRKINYQKDIMPDTRRIYFKWLRRNKTMIDSDHATERCTVFTETHGLYYTWARPDFLPGPSSNSSRRKQKCIPKYKTSISLKYLHFWPSSHLIRRYVCVTYKTENERLSDARIS